MGHLWVSTFCTQAALVVKTDDDIYVDLYGLQTVAPRYIQDKVPSSALFFFKPIYFRARYIYGPVYPSLLVQRYTEGHFMLGVVNRYWKHIVRSADDYFNKWLVTYDELPRNEQKFPGNSPEYYPDYIGT